MDSSRVPGSAPAALVARWASAPLFVGDEEPCLDAATWPDSSCVTFGGAATVQPPGTVSAKDCSAAAFGGRGRGASAKDKALFLAPRGECWLPPSGGPAGGSWPGAGGGDRKAAGGGLGRPSTRVIAAEAPQGAVERGQTSSPAEQPGRGGARVPRARQGRLPHESSPRRERGREGGSDTQQKVLLTLARAPRGRRGLFRWMLWKPVLRCSADVTGRRAARASPPRPLLPLTRKNRASRGVNLTRRRSRDSAGREILRLLASQHNDSGHARGGRRGRWRRRKLMTSASKHLFISPESLPPQAEGAGCGKSGPRGTAYVEAVHRPSGTGGMPHTGRSSGGTFPGVRRPLGSCSVGKQCDPPGAATTAPASGGGGQPMIARRAGSYLRPVPTGPGAARSGARAS
jgi:hypothetical protein